MSDFPSFNTPPAYGGARAPATPSDACGCCPPRGWSDVDCRLIRLCFFELRLTLPDIHARFSDRYTRPQIDRFLRRLRTSTGARKTHQWTTEDQRVVRLYYFTYGHSLGELRADHFPDVPARHLKEFVRTVRETFRLTHPRSTHKTPQTGRKGRGGC